MATPTLTQKKSSSLTAVKLQSHTQQAHHFLTALLHSAPDPEALLSLILTTDFRTNATPPLQTVKLSYHQRKAFDFLLRTTLFTSTPLAPSSSTAAATTTSNTTITQQLVITEEDRQLLARLFLLTFIHCPTASLSFKYLAYETPEQLIRLFHLLNHTTPILRQQLHQQRQRHQKTTRLFVLTVAYHLLHAVYYSYATTAFSTTTSTLKKSQHAFG